jgi:hypothetical protein
MRTDLIGHWLELCLFDATDVLKYLAQINYYFTQLSNAGYNEVLPDHSLLLRLPRKYSYNSPEICDQAQSEVLV